MRVKIYQIDESRDKNHVKFTDYANTCVKNISGRIDEDIYNEVFNAEIDFENLDLLYDRFNNEKHPLFRGHSMSISDVAVTDEGAYFCDGFGFAKIDFDESLTQKPENLMRVVYVEPNRKPYTAEVEHTLEAEQKAVGGFIECVYNDDNTCIVDNEEGKLIGLEGNRRISEDGQSVIAGSFFVVGLTEDDFRGLSDEEVNRYMEVFKEPDQISRQEVEADTGFTIYPVM